MTDRISSDMCDQHSKLWKMGIYSKDAFNNATLALDFPNCSITLYFPWESLPIPSVPYPIPIIIQTSLKNFCFLLIHWIWKALSTSKHLYLIEIRYFQSRLTGVSSSANLYSPTGSADLISPTCLRWNSRWISTHPEHDALRIPVHEGPLPLHDQMAPIWWGPL